MKALKWVTFGLEAILAIPLIGGAIVLGTSYFALLVMVVLHIIGLVQSKKAGVQYSGNVVGIISSLLAWIPGLGWILHVVTAIVLLVNLLAKDDDNVKKVQTL